MNRRDFLASSAWAGTVVQPGGERKLKTKHSREIKSSPISIGFETLDRKMFDPERTWEWMGKSGVKWARCQTGWARTETRPGVYDFAWLDRVVDQLLAEGVQPWFNVGYGNRLYTPDAPHETAVGWAPLNSPQALEAWKKYIDKLAVHFKGRVRHFEIWNEPNIPAYWQPTKPSGKEYARLAEITGGIFRKRISDAVIIGGAYAGFGSIMPYAEECMEAGLGKVADRISFHPYQPSPETNYELAYRAFDSMLRSYNPRLRTWQGENGAPSDAKTFGALSGLPWNEASQAKWLLRRLLIDLAVGVEVTSYFLIVDLANYVTAKGLDGRTNFKGVLKATDYQPKPAYFALQNLCTLFDGDTVLANDLLRPQNVEGAKVEEVQTASFRRMGKPLMAVWLKSALPTDSDRTAKMNLSAWFAKGAKLEQPVTVCLRTGSVKPCAMKGSGMIEFPGLTVPDWPVVITDASVVPV